MGAAVDRITARLAAGDTVKPNEYAAAKLEDEFVEVQALAAAERASKEAEAARVEAIETAIDVFAVEVDDASAQLETALTAALTALDNLDAARNTLEGTVTRHCHRLAHELGYPMTYDEVMGKTGGRVIYVPVESVAAREPRKLAVGPPWIEWRHNRLAERAERGAA